MEQVYKTIFNIWTLYTQQTTQSQKWLLNVIELYVIVFLFSLRQQAWNK